MKTDLITKSSQYVSVEAVVSYVYFPAFEPFGKVLPFLIEHIFVLLVPMHVLSKLGPERLLVID